MATVAEEQVRLRHRAERLAVDLPPLLVAAERVAATVIQGVHGRRSVGQGETFWQFRRYGPGDSATSIDWRQSARSRHVFVRETEWEAAQTVWLWCDTSSSMSYRSSDRLPTKVDRARTLLLALATMLMRGAERFALLGTGFPPSTGRAALYNLAELVMRDRPEQGLPANETLPRYAQAVLFGDFLEPVSRIREAVLGLAAQGVGGQILQVLDPAEEDLPFVGRVRFQGLEREPETLISRVDAIRSSYHGRIEGHLAALREIARAAGWGVIQHRTDHPAESALLALYLALAPMTGR